MSNSQFIFDSLSYVSNGQPRLVSGEMICIRAPNGRKWEIYVEGTDGIEMFQRYATPAEVRVLKSALKDAKKRGYSIVKVLER